MLLRSSDISVVVQGAVDKENTPKCLESIRKYLPNAEIILSTWKGTDVSGLDYDKVVISEDPGAERMDVNAVSNYNINRMLFSSQQGIAEASGTYILKLRSDIVLTSNHFLKYWNKFNVRNNQYCLARHKILTSSLYTCWAETGIGVEQGKVHPTPFHISDWWHFGLKEDIKLLFSCPLTDGKAFARYFEFHEKTQDYEIEWLKHRLWRFPPEQYLGVKFAEKLFPDLKFDNCLEYKNVDKNQSQQFILNNFIPLDYAQSGILVTKNPYKKMCQKFYKIPAHVFPSMYRFYIYKRLYSQEFNKKGFNLYVDIQKIIYFFKNWKKLKIQMYEL